MSFTSTNISAVISKQTGKAQNSNTLAFCVDENYLPYALFVAEQFIYLHPELPCDICICLTDIDKVPKNFRNTQIRFIELSISGIDSLPVGQLSLAAYHRLFLPQIFENTYKYIIYLDADTYINKPFYDDLLKYISRMKKDFCVAASADIMELKFRSSFDKKPRIVDLYVKTYHQFEHIYRNSGVLVFNTKNYVIQDVLNQVFDYAVDNADRLQCHDQSALNGALLNNIELLPFGFNWQINKLTYEFTDTVNPYIIHFISNNKPWRTDNKYTKHYQSFYIDFLSENFPDITPDILSMLEQRRRNPKYDNPIREFISREGERMKGNLIDYFTQASKSKESRDKYSIKEILIETPFLMSIDNSSTVVRKNNS
ncbi:lipopolysaccharide biosynthesis glycosyltransferase [Psychrobacter sp. PL19]|uniref:glycosyltransferase family 8 protein n=1 Tax=Psychrobacter sp. PL19 TaxID=2760711 RepID=UPI001AEB58C8